MALHSQARHSVARRSGPHGEGGWVLLTLLLAMALMVIFAAAIVPSITFEIKRDREEEMIHRGVQYSRAIRAYYKKFGRYPTKIEDLESSNNLRFLRKRYKDPLNCKNSKCEDFKLLHFGDVQMTLSAMGGANIPGATPVSAMNGGGSGGLSSSGGLSQSSSFGGNSGFGSTSNSSSNSSFGQNPTAAGGLTTGSDTSQSASQAASGTTAGQTSDATGTNASGSNGNSNQLGSGQIIGAPIVGVASISKDTTIREFNHKTKYKDWAFVYDPTMDRGGIITTPYQPQLQGFGQQGTPNLNGQTGTTGTGFGSGNSLGSSPSGFQNSPNAPAAGTSSMPNPPSNSPQQQ
jgi:type II secretory pathway pseudopilin PulG